MNNIHLIPSLGYTGALLTKLGAENSCMSAANLIRDIVKELSAREWDSGTAQNIANLLHAQGISILDDTPHAASAEEILDALASLGYEVIKPTHRDSVTDLCKDHLGFEPTIDQLNDLVDEVNGPPDTVEYQVCGSCLMYVAHSEEPADDPEWDAGTVNDRMFAEMNGKNGEFVTGVRPTSDDPEGAGHEDFSHYKCELCGGLPGERHGLTLHFHPVKEGDHG